MPKLKLEEIEIEALLLPEWDRLHLAEILLASLDNDENVRDACVAEAERRAGAQRSQPDALLTNPDRMPLAQRTGTPCTLPSSPSTASTSSIR
jgi:hypothetical protein